MPIKRLIKKLLKGLFLVFVTITLAVVMKVFLFASFKVPTDSMKPTLIPGDFVLVNKLLIGPRIYQNLDFLKGKKTPYRRINGIQRIRRNDILVFDAPYITAGTLKQQVDVFYVKRCIAIPGDTFRIENGIYKVQGRPDTLGNYPNQLILSQMPDEEFEGHIYNCFPADTTFQWNIKYFGPLYIPGKGDTLELNPQNIVLYQSLIQYETQKKITIIDGQLFLDRTPLSPYTFTQNYYFMVGDNVIESHDSRYWGLLPEEFIVGKVAIIWKSEDPQTGKFRWNRFLKPIK